MSGQAQGPRSGWRPVAEAVKEVDATPYLDLMDRRFGISPSAFERYVFFQPNKDGVWIVNRDLQAPVRPEPHVLGMPFFRIDMRFPRPSTNAVLKFGHLATRHRLELEDPEIAAALYRRSLSLDADRVSGFEGNGYVILFYRGRPLGLGYFRPGREDDAQDPGGELKGMCPKMWTSKLGLQPPAQRPVPWETGSEEA